MDILPASQRMDEINWYRGTADAVAQNIDIIDSYGIKYVVVLAGDHIYKMDYEIMLQQHAATGADVTIGCLTVPKAEASAFGVMHVDANMRITSFLEKPKDPPTIPGDPANSLASMGIYVFDWVFLRDLLMRDMEDPNSKHDFGMDLIPAVVAGGKAMAHKFSDSCVTSGRETEPYWRDVGTVDAYWEANIGLTEIVPALDLYDNSWPIWTYAEITPPAKFVHDLDDRRGEAISSLVSGGCIVSGARVQQSLLFTGCHVHSHARLEGAVVLPQVDIGRAARLTRVVVDRGVRIPAGLVVGEDPVADALRLPRGARVCVAEMLQEAGGVPIAVATMRFPAARFPGLLDHLAGGDSVTAALARYGIDDYVRTRNRITAQLPGEGMARLLQQQASRPVLCVESIDADTAGVPIKHGTTVFGGDRVQVTFDATEVGHD
jgi:glucose-1-phosphate adenylyltransferase